MKKYVIKATALAIGALVGGAAVASVDFSASPFVATTDTFASELSYAKTGGTTISGAKLVKTKLGFGVSSGQTRFIRVNLTNATIGATPAAGANVVNATTAFANSIVAQGGQPDDNYVIYQVTGAAAGHTASDIVNITLPDLFVASNAAPVKVTYALYADPVAAANQTAGTTLSNQAGDLFSFASGIKFKVTTKTQTATVADAYKKFAGSYGPVNVGEVAYDAATGVFDATGVQVTLAQIVGATSKVKFLGDFTFTDGATTPAQLFLGATAGCGAAVALTSIADDMLSASYTIGNTPITKSLCVQNDILATGSAKVLNVQNFTVDFNPVALNAGVTGLVDPSAVALGGIDHDGTTLTAPFATIHPDYLSRVVLTSSYGSDVPVTATVTAENGATCNGASYTGTLAKNSQLVIPMTTICPSLTSGATRLAVTVNVAAPRTAINGVYNVMNYDQVTGKTNSLISYVMVVPGTN